MKDGIPSSPLLMGGLGVGPTLPLLLGDTNGGGMDGTFRSPLLTLGVGTCRASSQEA